MDRHVAIEWDYGQVEGRIHVFGGKWVAGSIVRGKGALLGNEFSIHSDGPCRLELRIETNEPDDKAMVTVAAELRPFSFFLRDVQASYPIYIPAYKVAVTEGRDERSYVQIAQSIQARGLLTNLQKWNMEPEESYAEAAIHTRSLPSQTWLGLSRDIRIFSAGFRGVGGEEKLWDWVQPRFHGFEAPLPENNNKPVRYHFLLGRGIGCEENVSRRLEDGSLPILRAEIVDNDIQYHCTSFVSYEQSPLTEQTVKGTHYLIADGYGHGHMLTEEQNKQRQELLAAEMNHEEETVFYFRAEAVNTADVPRYAWFRNVMPNAYILNNKQNYTFDGQTGFTMFSPERICTVSKLNGRPLHAEETAVLILPGETVTFEFYLPHRPITSERAECLIQQNFEYRLEECRQFWRSKLSAGAQIHLPEKRLDEMVKAGLLHLELVAYGLEPSGTIVPTIGVYTAIGSESSPIIQFMDSMGRAETAKRSLMYFLDKQHEDGFIQNFGGYMLETGAALWSIGEHYRYTRDEQWIDEIKPRLLKAYNYLMAWRKRNQKEELRGKGYGMLEGKTADPEDPFHSFMLNGYAYIGMNRLAEMLASSDPQLSETIHAEAEAFRADIRTGLFEAMSRSPVVPLADGSWVPTVPPWVEHRGPLSLYAEGGRWLTHGSVVARDSLLGPLYLVLQEVAQPDEEVAEFMLYFHSELMCMRNVALSQPYYSIHPFVHLMRGEVKPFLKAYYNGFSGLADRETYTFWEHYFHASPHKTHEEGWFLMQTRKMLYMEEGPELKLLPGIPRVWLEHGKQIELQNVASYFGLFSLKVESQLEKGIIRATLQFDPDRSPQTVLLRLPHPDGRRPREIIGGTYEADKESVRIDTLHGEVTISLRF